MFGGAGFREGFLGIVKFRRGRGGVVEGFEEGDIGVAFLLRGGETGLKGGQEQIGAFGADRVVDIGAGRKDFKESG